MRRLLTGFAAILLLTGIAGVSDAQLTTIGTAQFGGTGTEYNLIWDDDNNGNSVVWLDYSNSKNIWESQNAWAAGLNLTLTFNIDPAYTVAWDDDAWRLPGTVDGTYVHGYDGTTTGGYNIKSSEMGHLYYEELGNLSSHDNSGVYVGNGNWGLNNTGDFDNLIESWYWSGTEFALHRLSAWGFNMTSGGQYNGHKPNDGYGLAVRSGQVSASSVPVPGAVWLLASGLMGIIGARRKLKK